MLNKIHAEADERKKMGWKVLAASGVLTLISIWVKRYKWTPIKTRKLVYNPPVTKQPPGIAQFQNRSKFGGK